MKALLLTFYKPYTSNKKKYLDMNKAILHLVFIDNNKNTHSAIESFMYGDNNDCVNKTMQIIQRESEKNKGYGITFSNLIK